MVDVTYTTFYRNKEDTNIKGTIYSGTSLKEANELDFLAKTNFHLYKGDFGKWKRTLEALMEDKSSKYNYY